MSENYIEAWYFLPQPSEDGKVYLNNTPNSPETEIRAGVVHTVEGPAEICERGLHASLRPLDALDYADSSMVARVRLSGEMDHDDDKLCATTREYLWIADATGILYEFVCDVVEKVLNREREAGREPHPDSWRAVETSRRYARGEATQEELEAAGKSAMAVWDAAWAKTRNATDPFVSRSIAEAAWVSAEAIYGPRGHAWEGEWRASVFQGITGVPCQDEQNAKLEEMLFALHAEAGHSASRG